MGWDVRDGMYVQLGGCWVGLWGPGMGGDGGMGTGSDYICMI